MMSRHHAAFEACNFNATEAGRQIRQTHSLIPRLDREVHNALHESIPSIPILGHTAMKGVAMRFIPTGNTLHDIDLLCLAYDRATNTRKSHKAERDIAGVAIELLMSQKPFISEGILRA